MDAVGWNRSTVGAVIMVTQTPDYRLPATACLMQHRLGLPTSCAAFDVNLGCSGYVYGLWLAMTLAASGTRVLLLVGDTITHHLAPGDKTVIPLFGDAGTATAIEGSPGKVAHFSLGTDGSEAQSLIIPADRNRSPEIGPRSLQPDGNMRGSGDLYMNGMRVYSFVQREVPPLIQSVVDKAAWTPDYFLLHQANKAMLQMIGRKLEIPAEKMPLNLDRFGNTSGSSIPLLMVTELRKELRAPQKLVLSGFGVGFSYGAVAIETDGVEVPPLASR